MAYVLGFITGALVLTALTTSNYELQRTALMLAIFPGWGTWALTRKRRF